jgi:uncharacterized damage-inducible protein DinB
MKIVLPKPLLFFLFLLGILNVSRSQSFLQDFSVRWEKAKAYTIAVAQAMPDSGYKFKPTEAERTFAEALAHICTGIDLHAEIFIKGRKEEELPKDQRRKLFSSEGKTKQQIIELITKTFDDATQMIKGFNSAKLEETVNFFGKTRTKLQIFLLLSDHVTHHRAQLLVYLRLKGIEPPEYIDYQ